MSDEMKSAPVGVEAIAAEIRASLGRGATVSTRRRWAVELEALAQQPAAVDWAMAKDALRYRIVRASPSLFESGDGYLTGIEADAKVDAYIEHTAATALELQQGGRR